MKIFTYFLEYLFVKFFFIIIKLFPLSISENLSRFIFRTIGKLSNADKIALNNCRFVFPNLEALKIRKIIDESWNNIGLNLCELLNFNKLINKNKVCFSGLEHIDYLRKNNLQAIFISIHQSNWELLVPMLDRLNFKIGGIYRHINNFFLDRLILKIRKSTLISNQNFYTPKGKQSAKELIEAINKNFSIVLLIDQKDSAGENIKFFKKDVKTQIGFLKIARKFNLPIVPIKNTRLRNGQIELNFQKPIFHDNLQISDSVMMRNIHELIENWIISNPSQWFWQHKRFN